MVRRARRHGVRVCRRRYKSGVDWTPLTAKHIGVDSTGWHGETPLWFYILREADAYTGGQRLGPVGGRIVTEVLVGLIDADPTSFRQSNQEWQPQKTLSELPGWISEAEGCGFEVFYSWSTCRIRKSTVLSATAPGR